MITDTHYGQVWLGRHALALFVFVGLVLAGAIIPRVGAKAFLCLALALMAFAHGGLALSGHGIALEDQWLAVGAHGLHVVAASVWLGGLFALALLLVSSGDTPAAVGLAFIATAFRRFSELAFAMMILIVMSGFVISALHIDRWPPLFGTQYGHLVLLKVTILIAILVLAAHLRWRLLPKFSSAGVDSKFRTPDMGAKIYAPSGAS